MQVISSHQGGTSIGSLGERDQLIRDMFEQQRMRAIIDEFPIQDLPAGTRVFRTPNKTGYKHVYSMRRKIVNNLGDTLQEPGHDFIEFESSTVSGAFGQLILKPSDPKFKEKLAIVEDLMTNPDYSWLQVVDWHQVRSESEQSEIDKQAAMLADPSWLKKVAEKARKMGINLTEGFGDEKGKTKQLHTGASE
jgi:hypothetical protein